MIDYAQKEYISLIQLLNLRAIEYRKLCDKFNKIKQGEIIFDDDKLLKLKELFKDNNEEIADINRRLVTLKRQIEVSEIEKAERYSLDNLFKKQDKKETQVIETKNEASIEIIPLKAKKNIFVQILNKIKAFFKKR